MNDAPPSGPGVLGAGAAPLLELDRVGLRSLRGEVLWRDLSLSVQPGEVIGLLGPNGSGKSSLLHALIGEHALDSGTLRWRGAPAQPRRDRRLRAQIGVAFQRPVLDPALTVRENLELAAALYGVVPAERPARADEIIEAFDLAPLAARPAGELSGGEARRVDLGRALLHHPALVLLDEPSQGLDAYVHELVWGCLAHHTRQLGAAVVVATHRPDVAEACSRLVLLRAGRPPRIHTPASLLTLVGRHLLVVEGVPQAAMSEALAAQGLSARSLADGHAEIEVDDGPRWVAKLAPTLASRGLTSLSVRRPGLAEAFSALMGGSLSERDGEGIDQEAA